MVLFFFVHLHRTDGHTSRSSLQLLLQHQRLPHPPYGPGPGPPLPGQPRVPGGPGHAKCQQGAAHSAYTICSLAILSNPVCYLECGLKALSALILSNPEVLCDSEKKYKTDPLAGVGEEKGRMPDDRKGKTGGIIRSHPAL